MTSRISPKVLVGAAIVGAGGATATYVTAGHERFWANWLLWFLFIATMGLGALFLVAIEHMVGARWSVPLRRVPERVSTLLLLAIPLGLVALLSLPVLYPWARPGEALSKIVIAKRVWLNVPFFSARVVGTFALWLLAFWVLVVGSWKQDKTKDPKFNLRARRFAPAFMAILAISATFIAFDWLSSLEPEWFSDIFGVYIFAGAFLAGLSATALGVLYLQSHKRLPEVRKDHVYNIGAFMFGFTVFWTYIGFAQYMLMWYADMPEEIGWYKMRIEGAWHPVPLVLAAIHFVIPFFALIPRPSKSDPRRLRWVAPLVLIAQWLDLYWLLFPSITKRPLFSWPELSFALLFVSVGLLWLRGSMTKGEDVPVGDPFLREGLEFHL